MGRATATSPAADTSVYIGDVQEELSRLGNASSTDPALARLLVRASDEISLLRIVSKKLLYQRGRMVYIQPEDVKGSVNFQLEFDKQPEQIAVQLVRK